MSAPHTLVVAPSPGARRRIWTELLTPDRLGAPSTIALLTRYGLEPLVALPPARQTPAMADALRALSAAGLRVGLWPLLDDADGYWPSRGNATAYAARVEATLRFAADAAVAVSTIAVDLEPPLAITTRLVEGSTFGRTRLLARMAAEASTTSRITRATDADALFARLAADLDTRGVETLAAVVPNVLVDLAAGARLWQDVFETPVAGPGWRVVSPMLYTSMIAAMLPAGGASLARVLLHEGARVLVRTLGPRRASVSVGLAGPGKLQDEPVLPSPEALAADVAAARAAGVDDLALFSLEGVLGRAAPEAWLDAFVATAPRPPRGLTSRVALGLVRGMVWASRPVATVGRLVVRASVRGDLVSRGA